MKAFISLVLFLSFLYINAQAPKKFYNRFGGDGYDYGYDVKQTLDKGYIITGSTSSIGNGNTDMYLVKLDSMGYKRFEVSFGGMSNESGKSIVQLVDSSYVILGYTSSLGFGGYDIYMVKASKTGAWLWEKTIGGSDWDFGNSIQATTDGGFIIAGQTDSYGRGNSDGYVIKTDANGIITWSKTFGGRYSDEFKSVIQTADGGYMLTGYTKSYNDTITGDAWIFRLDVNGDSIYSQSVGGLYEDVFNNVVQLPNLNFYFVGSNKSHTNGSNSVNWQYETDNTNSFVFNNFIGNTNTERYNSSCVGVNGNIVTVGFNNYMSSFSDANIHVFTPGLGYIAYYPFGVENMDELFSVSATKDKGFVAVGTCKGNTSLLNDILFVKTDSTGSYGSSIIGVIENTTNKIKPDIFPNPANNLLHISIPNFSEFDNLNYSIININGQVVLTGNVYQEKTILNLDLNSGLYFLQINHKQEVVFTTKISVIK